MRVLMFGWEFPPNNQGGLGTACEGLVKGLTHQDIDVTLVLPQAQESHISRLKIVSPNFKKIKVNSLLQAYQTESSYDQRYEKSNRSLYGRNLFSEVIRYAQAAEQIAREEEFDVIHAHDWLTYKAGVAAKKVSGKPLVVHMHATEFDRTGGNGTNQFVYDIEKEGMEQADLVLPVSNFTKDKVIKHYGIDPAKIYVVHNAVEFNHHRFHHELLDKKGQMVLFLGRVTLQKGPDYFIETAKKVLQHKKDVTFVIAGTGDMKERLIRQVAAWGLGDKILFAGFLRGKEIDRMYQMADVYVMPSVSEPFGITPLEAMRNDVPVIISKQSGVSEVISHCLKVDFWDIDETVNKILGVLEYRELSNCLKQNGTEEVYRFGEKKTK
jgi:glycosyltransferase involved in cell wall biosynthesis